MSTNPIQPYRTFKIEERQGVALLTSLFGKFLEDRLDEFNIQISVATSFKILYVLILS